ncbi:MAG: glycine cleavage system protein GcvH [Ruminococcaceae bacterium]|jgi:glycine cleavage system H protein|nr:glycine cleavage system protein GcvH [Oscillospiraceae bacterium]
MKVLADLKYSKSHEWLKEDSDVCTVGLTDFAQEELGDIVFVNLPMVGDAVTAGETFADVESVKAVVDVYSPVTGVVTEVNEELIDNPAMANEAPYDAWLIKVAEVTETEELLDAEAYEAHCAAEKE